MASLRENWEYSRTEKNLTSVLCEDLAQLRTLPEFKPPFYPG